MFGSVLEQVERLVVRHSILLQPEGHQAAHAGMYSGFPDCNILLERTCKLLGWQHQSCVAVSVKLLAVLELVRACASY